MNPHPARSSLLAMLGVLVALTLIAPGADAAEYEPGTAVTYKDWDYTPQLSDKSGGGKTTLCALDVDGDGNYDAGEPLFMDTDSNDCAGGLEPKDIRFTTNDYGEAGKEVKATDHDFGKPAIEVTHGLKYYDMQGEGAWEEDNILYIDIMNLANHKVDVGDFRISPDPDTGLPAFSHVKAGDLDINRGLADLGADLQTAEMVYKTAKAWYLNPNLKVIGTAKFGVDDEDVRISKKIYYPDVLDGEAAGGTVDLSDIEARLAALEALEARVVELETKVENLEAAIADLAAPSPASTLPEGAKIYGSDTPAPASESTPGVGAIALVLAAVGVIVMSRRMPL